MYEVKDVGMHPRPFTEDSTRRVVRCIVVTGLIIVPVVMLVLVATFTGSAFP